MHPKPRLAKVIDLVVYMTFAFGYLFSLFQMLAWNRVTWQDFVIMLLVAFWWLAAGRHTLLNRR